MACKNVANLYHTAGSYVRFIAHVACMTHAPCPSQVRLTSETHKPCVSTQHAALAACLLAYRKLVGQEQESTLRLNHNQGQLCSILTWNLTGNSSMSPYLFRNLDTLAKCLLAWPMTSMTGSSCRSDMGNFVAIQHFALILRPFFFTSSTGFGEDCEEILTSFSSSSAAASA